MIGIDTAYVVLSFTQSLESSDKVSLLLNIGVIQDTPKISTLSFPNPVTCVTHE